MKIFIKKLNPCATRKQDLLHYEIFLEKYGHEIVSLMKDSDLILVWTCGYRGDTIENSISELKRYREEHKDKTIIALGCLPDIDRTRLWTEFGGLIVPWRNEESFFEGYFQTKKGSFKETSPILCEEPFCKNASIYRNLNPDKDAIFADQFIKMIVVRGCPYNCTYCTEKRAFPPFKSTPLKGLIDTCKEPIEKGYHQIIFLGDCVGRYGADIGSSLPELIKQFKKEYPQSSYLLQNVHPIDFLKFRRELKREFEDDTIFHLNIPIQSASNKILSLMDRKYTREDLDVLFTFLLDREFRRFDTHIIIGFPQESSDDFLDTIDFLKKYRPIYVLVSKYYDSPQTLSYKLDNKIEETEIVERVATVEKVLIDENITYNIDGSDFMKDRFSRINQQGE